MSLLASPFLSGTFLHLSYSNLSFLPQDVSRGLSSFSPPGRPRGFKLRLPLLHSLSNSKASLDDAEAGHIPTATPLPLHPDRHNHESLGLGDLLPLPPLAPDHKEQITGSRYGLHVTFTGNIHVLVIPITSSSVTLDQFYRAGQKTPRRTSASY